MLKWFFINDQCIEISGDKKHKYRRNNLSRLCSTCILHLGKVLFNIHKTGSCHQCPDDYKNETPDNKACTYKSHQYAKLPKIADGRFVFNRGKIMNLIVRCFLRVVLRFGHK